MNQIMMGISLILLMGISLLLIISANFFVIISVFICASIIARFSQRKYFFDRIRLLCGIGTMIILFQLIFGSMTLEERIVAGLYSALRISSISMMVFSVVHLISPGTLLRFFGFFPQTMRFVIAMTLSLIPVIMKEAYDIRLVQKSRNVSSIWSSLIPLIHRVMQRAETVSMSIISRGFQ